MLRFKSIISRIVFLHVVAVVITSILMSLALSWLLSYATDNIHNKSMQEQAIAVGEHLSVGPDGRLQLKLPSDLLGIRGRGPDQARALAREPARRGAPVPLSSAGRPRVRPGAAAAPQNQNRFQGAGLRT